MSPEKGKRQKAKTKRQKSLGCCAFFIKDGEAIRLTFAFCLLFFAFCLFLYV